MATATIRCSEDTTREISGTLVREHFLVHIDEDYRYNGWTVTHIMTGFAVVKGIKERASAIKYARRMANVAKLAGLDLSISEVTALTAAAGWSEFRDEVRKIREKEGQQIE